MTICGATWHNQFLSDDDIKEICDTPNPEQNETICNLLKKTCIARSEKGADYKTFLDGDMLKIDIHPKYWIKESKWIAIWVKEQLIGIWPLTN